MNQSFRRFKDIFNIMGACAASATGVNMRLQETTGAYLRSMPDGPCDYKTERRIDMTIVMVLLLLPLTGYAQWLNYPTAGVPRLPNGQPNLTAPPPRTPEGRPDFTGLWEPDTSGGTQLSTFRTDVVFPPEWYNIGAQLKDGLPFRPWARELRDARNTENSKDSPDAKCLPMGPFLDHSNRSPRKIIQVPGLLVILYEKSFAYRQIFTDGRPLPTDPQPSFYGYSSGKWEDDALVVQTVGLRDKGWADQEGSPITEAAKVTEHFRRPSFESLEIELTVDDTKAYTVPWTVKLRHHIKLDTDLLEYVCNENEKDAPHLVGK